MAEPNDTAPQIGAYLKDYHKQLNDWHLQLAIVAEAVHQIALDYPDDDKRNSIFYIVEQRLQDLVGSCPFPTVN
jgi:hypothetical protein